MKKNIYIYSHIKKIIIQSFFPFSSVNVKSVKAKSDTTMLIGKDKD